jgi:molybdopterin synthase catalytic subunit
MRRDEEAKRQTVKISYEEFEKMAQSLIYYMNKRIKEDSSLEESIDF